MEELLTLEVVEKFKSKPSSDLYDLDNLASYIVVLLGDKKYNISCSSEEYDRIDIGSIVKVRIYRDSDGMPFLIDLWRESK